jgi:hypothetical protein
MNIYDYFESADIANHCKDIKREFNALERAAIISRSHKTIPQKIDAWTWLLNTTYDKPLSGNPKKKKMLHASLIETIEYYRNGIDAFLTHGENEVYCTDDDGIFISIDDFVHWCDENDEFEKLDPPVDKIGQDWNPPTRYYTFKKIQLTERHRLNNNLITKAIVSS